MARRGETQKTLAELLKKDASTISRKLNGETEWTIEEVEIICKHYEKDFFELFTNQE